MRSNIRCVLSVLAVFGLVCTGILSSQTPARSGTEGVLKLKVRTCAGTFWLSNAQVDVSIQRPGVGEVDSDTGWSDGSGYVEFTFSDLEGGDQAHVTVTPEGKDPDTDHTYYWIPPQLRIAGYWDLGIMSESICEDSWYDQENNIILVLYE